MSLTSPTNPACGACLLVSFLIVSIAPLSAQDNRGNQPDSEPVGLEYRETRRLRGHTGPIYGIAYSPDDTRIASAGGPFNEPGELVIWDADTGAEQLKLTGHQGPVYSVAFSPDGSQIASAGSDGVIRLWNGETGTETRSFPGHTGEAYGVLFSRDGSLLMSCGGTQDRPGEIIIRNAVSGEEVRRFEDHAGAVLTLALSPDGQMIASAGLDQVIRIRSLQTGELIRELAGHTGRVSSIAFGPADEMLLSGSSDRTLRQWNIRTGEQTEAWIEHSPGRPSMEIHQIAVSHTGHMAATAASNRLICLWNAQGDKLASLRGHKLVPRCVAFSSNGKQLVTAGSDKTIIQWELPTPDPLPLFVKGNSPNKPVLLRTASSWIAASDVSPNGRLIATGDNSNAVVVSNAVTGKQVFDLKGHTGWVTDVSFSPDGRWLASSSYDKSVIIWDLQTGKEEFRWSTLSTVMTCAFSPDSMWIACNSGTGPDGRDISVWEALTGVQKYTFSKHGATVMDLQFNADGTKLASASNDCSVILWDMQNGVDLAVFRGFKDGRTSNFWAVDFSPDGTILAAAGRHEQIYLWDIETKALLKTIDVANGGIHDLEFTPDGKWLISSGGVFNAHGDIMAWDTASGRRVLELPAHTNRTKSIALSPRGDWLVSTSDDKTVKLWNIEKAISRATKNPASEPTESQESP